MVFEMLVFGDPKFQHQDKQRVSIKTKKKKKQKKKKTEKNVKRWCSIDVEKKHENSVSNWIVRVEIVNVRKLLSWRFER